MAEEFLQYKNKPLVRCGDVIYYGDMNDKCVAKLTIKSKNKKDNMDFADRVFIQILNTDFSDPKKLVIQKGEQNGLFSAIDTAYVWLKKAMKNFTKDTIIGDILDIDETTAPIFLSIGMHCLGCPASRGETVEQACMVHGVDVDALVKAVNEHIKDK